MAIDHLALEASRHLALIGAGALGQAHLRHVLPIRNWESISVYADDLAGNPQIQSRLKALDFPGADFRFGETVREPGRRSHAVYIVGHAAGIELGGPEPAGFTVTSISTNAVNAHEVSPSSLPLMDVYCDNKQSTPDSAGEMVLATKQGIWDREKIIGDLADLVSGRCPRPDHRRHVFFRSIGMGLEDVAIAYALLQHLQSNNA